MIVFCDWVTFLIKLNFIHVDPNDHIHKSYAEQKKAAMEATKMLHLGSKDGEAVQAHGLRRKRGQPASAGQSGAWICIVCSPRVDPK